jgi:sortase A
MRLARVLGAIGRGLISAGVIVLLFVAYQLWGTGLQAAAAQGDLGNEFAAATGIETDTSDVVSLVEEARASQARIESGQIFANDTEAVLAVASDATNDDDTSADSGTQSHSEATADLFEGTFDDDTSADSGTQSHSEATADLFEGTFDTAERQEILARLYPDAGEAFARIFIPDINVDQITVEGVSVEDLRKGPGHYQTTPNPGQAGNAAIAGHRTTYGAPFHRVDELQPNDPIFVTTAQGTFEYRVLGFEDPRDPAGPDLGYFIVAPSGTQVLDQKEGQNILTLTACHPKYSARQRIIVQAELVGEPAPTIPREDAAELGAVTLANEDIDARAAAAQAADGDAEIPEEEQIIIGDDVAADDDPSVDADGNPIEPVYILLTDIYGSSH